MCGIAAVLNLSFSRPLATGGERDERVAAASRAGRGGHVVPPAEDRRLRASTAEHHRPDDRAPADERRGGVCCAWSSGSALSHFKQLITSEVLV